MKKIKVFEQIYKVVKKIPSGKVATYGQIADLTTKEMRKQGNEERKLVTARTVGWALHANPDSKNIPCHRVVRKDGSLANGFAFGGIEEQKRRLEAEGVVFSSKYKVDLDGCGWT